MASRIARPKMTPTSLVTGLIGRTVTKKDSGFDDEWWPATLKPNLAGEKIATIEAIACIAGDHDLKLWLVDPWGNVGMTWLTLVDVCPKKK